LTRHINILTEKERDIDREKMAKHQAPGQSEFAEYEWMVEDGADEKLQREVEEQLKYAELERMVMQLEDESGDMQVS